MRVLAGLLVAVTSWSVVAPDMPPIRDPAQVSEVADRMPAFQETPAPTTTTTTLPPRITGSGQEVAKLAILSQGGTLSEAQFAASVCPRESHCQLGVWNYNPRTRDDSWGPWQINYYGSLRESRIALIGPPETNVESWERAARNFLVFLRAYGRCPWSYPNYCS